MIVDDEAAITTQLEERLTLMGYEITGSASSCQEAVEMARRTRPDIILMDIVMPGRKDGIDAAEIIKAELDIPVIFLTAYADQKFIDKARIVEPFGYIVKPFHEREIKATIEIALHKKNIERRLRESEENFRALAENANDGILIAVEGGKPSYANRRTSEITGYSVSELLKMTIRDLAHPDEFEKINKRHKTIIAGKPFQRQFETMIIRKDGKEIPIELSSAMFIWHGQPADMVVIRDIADRKQAEEALLESEKKHRSIIENLPMGIHMYQLEPDGELHFIGANSAADEILGVDNTQFLGKTIYEAFPKIQETEIPERFRIIAEEGGFWKKEDIIYKDENIEGAFENYNFQTSPGKMVSLFSDITDRKQAEEALQQAHDKLEQRVKERTNELERKSRSIEDVNTALNVMLKKRDADKLMIEERVLFNVKELIEPLIENLKKNGLNENQNGYVNALETFLAEIVSPFSQTLHTKFLNLTLSEIRVANLIKEGKTTKEIASLLNSTPRAIEFHRQNLRKKLGLSSRKANLGSHLLSLID